MSPAQPIHVAMVLEFASALAAGDFVRARNLLTTEMKEEWPPSALQADFTEMMEFAGEPYEVDDQVEDLEDWKGIQPGDIGWAYVSIMGEDEVEAVAVIVFMISQSFFLL